MTGEISLELGRIGDRQLRIVGEKVASATRLTHDDAGSAHLLDLLTGLDLDHAPALRHGAPVLMRPARRGCGP